MTDQLTLDTGDPTALVITIDLVRDFDGRWASRWPAKVVLDGLSAGAGRHDTRTGLVAAIEAQGWTLTHRHGDTWTAVRR